MKQIILSSLVLALIGIIGSPFVNGDITMILSNAGYNVPAWVSNSHTTIGGVYGAQHFLIAALGVTVPIWLAAAVAAVGAAGV